jgi:hypothetical protein
LQKSLFRAFGGSVPLLNAIGGLPHLRKCWVIPPQYNAEFVARMEDILEIYKRPYDSAVPVICMDK